MKLESIVAGVVLFSASFTIFSADLMTGDQIKAIFSGKTVTWKHMIKDKSGKSYLSEDGTMTGIDKGSRREGSWKVEGNQLCSSGGKCREIEADGKGGYYKLKNGAKRVVNFTLVEDGNTL